MKVKLILLLWFVSSVAFGQTTSKSAVQTIINSRIKSPYGVTDLKFTLTALNKLAGQADSTALVGGTETDPTVPSYVKSISTTDKTNWNAAFGWGNHAGLYVPVARSVISGTGLTGGGTLGTDRTLSVLYGATATTATVGNDSRVNNGQTAFGWGNHASAGYLTPTSSSTLTNKSIDGVGNTLTNIPYSVLTGTPAIPTNANYVDLTTAQTVSGIKTFGSPIILRAGSATAGTAPLSFTQGTALLTTPVARTIEQLTDKLYYTIETGAARKEIVMSENTLTVGQIPYTAGTQRLSGTTTFLFNTGIGGKLSVGTTSQLANLNIGANITATGTLPLAVFTGAAHTNQSASTELSDIQFNLGRTVQFATGNIATQRAIPISAPTYSFVGASTIGTAATLAISGAPVAGTNATITTPNAFWVQSGNSQFDGTTALNGNATLGGDLLADGNGTRSLGNAANKFGSLFVNDIYSVTNPLVVRSQGGISFRQSGSSNIVGGIFPTTGNWYFQAPGTGGTDSNERLQVTGTSKLDGNVSIPGGTLSLRTGTTTAGTSPLKFTSGTLLTTPEAGTVEYLNPKFYVTNATGRRELVMAINPFTTGQIAYSASNATLQGNNNFLYDSTNGLTSNKYNVSSLNTAPASATATGTTGEIRYTSDFIYVCIATNTWVRSALTTWP